MVFFALPCPSRTEQGALRIAMPYPSAEELAFKLPVLVRMPKQHDRKYVPRALQGAELERNRTYDDILPLSILSASQLAEHLGVQVQLHPRRATAALQPLQQQRAALHPLQQQQQAASAVLAASPPMAQPPPATWAAAKDLAGIARHGLLPQGSSSCVGGASMILRAAGAGGVRGSLGSSSTSRRDQQAAEEGVVDPAAAADSGASVREGEVCDPSVPAGDEVDEAGGSGRHGQPPFVGRLVLPSGLCVCVWGGVWVITLFAPISSYHTYLT